MMDVHEIENALMDEGYFPVCGVDEAGAGPLVGPVYAAAVILPRDIAIDGLTDSKKLTEKKRERLYDMIIESAVAWSVASVTAAEIDEINILNARMLAMDKAIRGLSVAPALAVIDGNRDTGISVPTRCVVKGDEKCISVSAASVLAKVSRDRYMIKLAETYPQYGFERHKGYGTKQHYSALREYGPCPEHRATFLRKLH